MEFIEILPKELQDEMKKLWSGCPDEIKKNARVIDVPGGYSFIMAGEECIKIYVILKGAAWGIDTQILGKQYKFKRFTAGRFLGEFECLSGVENYTITIQTETQCTLLVLSAKQYLNWMKNDVNALFMRTQQLLRILTIQTQNDRRFFLSPCRERMIQSFVKWYEINDQENLCLRKTHAELASAMGFVVRTVDRNIKKLEEGGYITLFCGKIHISNEQYQLLRQHLLENATYNDERGK